MDVVLPSFTTPSPSLSSRSSHPLKSEGQYSVKSSSQLTVMTFTYDGEVDVLYLYFYNMLEGKQSIDKCISLREDDVILEYSNNQIVGAQFIFPTKTMGIHFFEDVFPVEGKNPFILQAQRSETSVIVMFTFCGGALTECKTESSDVVLLMSGEKMVGMKFLNARNNLFGFQ